MPPKYVIGLDFGTDSVRSVIVGAEDGKEISTAVSYYSRWKEEVFTTMQGFHFYSEFFLNNLKCIENEIYPKFSTLALETEYFPDCVSNSHFHSYFLRPGQKYNHKTVLKFDTI